MTFDEWWESAKPASAVMDSAWEWEFRKYIAKAAWEAAQPQWRPIGEHADDTTVGYRGTIPGYLILYAPGREPDGHYRYAVVNGKYVNAHAAEEGISHWMPLPPAPEKTK